MLGWDLSQSQLCIHTSDSTAVAASPFWFLDSWSEKNEWGTLIAGLDHWAVAQSQCIGTRSDIACWHPSYRPLKKVVTFEPILRLCHAFRHPAIQSDRYIDISACALLDNRQRGFSLSAGVITLATFYLIIEQNPGDVLGPLLITLLEQQLAT